MKTKELKILSTKTLLELAGLQKTLSEEIVRLRMEKEMGKLKNVHSLSVKKQDLARVLTIMKAKK